MKNWREPMRATGSKFSGKAFLGNARGYRVGIPSVPLAELYEGCREAIVRRGGEVRLRCGVREIRVQRRPLRGRGSRRRLGNCSGCVHRAVPHDVLLELLPGEMARTGRAARRIAAHQNVADYERAFLVRSHGDDGAVSDAARPHDAVDFQQDAAVERSETNGRRRVQRTSKEPGEQSCRTAQRRRGQYLQLVISASYDLVPRSRQEIIELCRRELADVLPRRARRKC